MGDITNDHNAQLHVQAEEPPDSIAGWSLVHAERKEKRDAIRQLKHFGIRELLGEPPTKEKVEKAI